MLAPINPSPLETSFTYPLIVAFCANKPKGKKHNKLKTIFDSKIWQINQPIVLSKIYTELDRVEGVQSVTTVKIVNLYDSKTGYSGNVYDIDAATKAGVIYPSLDPSIFEIKFPNNDIIGKVVSL